MWEKLEKERNHVLKELPTKKTRRLRRNSDTRRMQTLNSITITHNKLSEDILFPRVLRVFVANLWSQIDRNDKQKRREEVRRVWSEVVVVDGARIAVVTIPEEQKEGWGAAAAFSRWAFSTWRIVADIELAKLQDRGDIPSTGDWSRTLSSGSTLQK